MDNMCDLCIKKIDESSTDAFYYCARCANIPRKKSSGINKYL